MDRPESPSKSQKKRDALALQALGERLVELPPHQLAQLVLPQPLRDAVETARAISARGGRKRQLQYIGKLMRETDPEPIRAALARIDGTDQAASALLHRAERWRTRLLDEGEAALEAFARECPQIDLGAVRTLVHAAVAERAAGRPPRDQRVLFRTLRDSLANVDR